MGSGNDPKERSHGKANDGKRQETRDAVKNGIDGKAHPLPANGKVEGWNEDGTEVHHGFSRSCFNGFDRVLDLQGPKLIPKYLDVNKRAILAYTTG